MTNSTSRALLGKVIGAPLNYSKIFEVEPQTLLITASMVAPMEEDSVPVGMLPPPHPLAATPSVTDLLRAHRAMSEWKIVSSTHLLTQCHDTGCDLCTQYIVHLACGGNASELSSWPPRLEQALDEAWPEEMARIREDTRTALHSKIEEVHRIIDEHDAQMATAKLDYTQLGKKYDEEVSYREHIEDKLVHADDKIVHPEMKLLDIASAMTRSSSSSTKRKADSLPPSDRSTTRASVGGRTVGGPPPAKRAKDDNDPSPPMPTDYDVDQWLSSPSKEGPPLMSRKGKGKARNSSPPDVDDASRPTAVLLPKKVAKPQLVALLPISVTGQLPRPLGKTAALSPYRPRVWYEDCPLDEPQFIELWEQANLTPLAQRTVVHHIVIKRQHQQHMRDTKPDAFIVAATLPRAGLLGQPLGM